MLMRSKLVFVTYLGLALCSRASGDYFHDQYSTQVPSDVRGDYSSTTEGTATNPLTMGACLFNAYPVCADVGGAQDCKIEACRSGPTVFSKSHYSWKYKGLSEPDSTFWVLTYNNELWHETGQNSGPPMQSEKPEGSGAETTPFLYKNNAFGQPCCTHQLAVSLNRDDLSFGPDGWMIPFLSLGADSRRGNGTVVGALQAAGRPDVVSFKTKQVFTAGLDTLNAGAHFVYAISYWNGKYRYVFLNLWNHNVETSGAVSNHPNGISRTWEWQFTESFLSPGGDLAYFDLEDVGTICPLRDVWRGELPTLLGQEVDVEIDLSEAFRCANDNGLFLNAMPTWTLPLYGVHFTSEGYDQTVSGEPSFIMNFHVRQMAMKTAYSLPAARAARNSATISADRFATYLDPETWEEVSKMITSCLKNSRCLASRENAEHLLSPWLAPAWDRSKARSGHIRDVAAEIEREIKTKQVQD